MFALHSPVSSVRHFSVLDVGLVVRVDALQSPSIVVALSHRFEIATSCIGSDDAHCKHVAIVHKEKSPC